MLILRNQQELNLTDQLMLLVLHTHYRNHFDEVGQPIVPNARYLLPVSDM